jgi:hypothetical protein
VRRSVIQELDGNRLLVFKENSNEFNLRHSIQLIINDPKSPEGNARNRFIDSFDIAESKVVDIRQFIDALHDYVVEKRALELANILLADKAIETDVTRLSEKTLSIVSYIAFSVVEESVFLSLKREIVLLVSSPEKRVI